MGTAEEEAEGVEAVVISAEEEAVEVLPLRVDILIHYLHSTKSMTNSYLLSLIL